MCCDSTYSFIHSETKDLEKSMFWFWQLEHLETILKVLLLKKNLKKKHYLEKDVKIEKTKAHFIHWRGPEIWLSATKKPVGTVDVWAQLFCSKWSKINYCTISAWSHLNKQLNWKLEWWTFTDSPRDYFEI